jgi:hypothetical protein
MIFAETQEFLTQNLIGIAYLLVKTTSNELFAYFGYINEHTPIFESSRPENTAKSYIFELNGKKVIGKRGLLIQNEYTYTDNVGTVPDQNFRSILNWLSDGKNIYASKFVVRAEGIVNKKGGEDPAFSAKLNPFVTIGDIPSIAVNVRLDATVCRDFSNGKTGYEFAYKLSKNITDSPWWGTALQGFYSMAAAGSSIDPVGLYLWTGLNAPKKMLGISTDGLFVESGVWIPWSVVRGESPAGDLKYNVGIKMKWGSETRWWR